MSVKSTLKENTPKVQCPSEHIEQRNFVSWWRKNFKELIFAIPNGGKRGKITAAKMKLEGVHKGVWDLFCPEKKLWIEFKRTHVGVLSKEQKEFGERMKAAGYTVIVAWGCQDAIDQVLNGARESWKRPKR